MEFVITTVNKIEDAEKLAEDLVRNGLSPCVNLINANDSIYMWKGEIVHEREHILLIKGEDHKKISEYLRKNHPYEVPEIIWFSGEISSDEYNNWFNSYFANETHN